MPNQKRKLEENNTNNDDTQESINKKTKLNSPFNFGEPKLLSPDIPLDLKLFSMINNDASLVNSSLQGGNISEAGLVLNAFVDSLVAENLSQNFEEFKKILSQIVENDKKIQKVISAGEMQDTTELGRLNSIKLLAEEFKASINNLDNRQSFFIPGGFFRHAMLYEFKIEDDKINLIVYNTGSGISNYHENKLIFENGVFKTKFFPACAYEFPKSQVDDLEFKNYLTELLKISIASCWEASHLGPSNPDLIIKHYDQKDLYDNALPLIAHIDGKRVDPKEVVKNNSFITGQRSGKCTEAVFHPLIRSTLKSEQDYQRFMCAYRQATIATFIDRKGSLSNSIDKRQVKNALSNLASRVYKHKDCFSSEEISQIKEFISKKQELLDISLMEIDEEQVSLEFQPSVIASSQHLPQVNIQHVTEIKQVSGSPAKLIQVDKHEKLSELVECKDTDESSELINKLTKVLSWAETAVTDLNIPPRAIIQQIEQILLTWPFDKEDFSINADITKDTINKIKKLISIYCKQTLIQFGINEKRSLKALFPNQVVTILSSLAIIAQVVIKSNDEVGAKFVQELMKFTHIVDLSNTYNPYLASGNLQYDLTFSKLYKFFNKCLNAKSHEKIKTLYQDVINSYPKQKDKLINYYATIQNKRNTESLTDLEKCMWVLTYHRKDILALAKTDQAINMQELIGKLDFLAGIDQVTAILGSMLSNAVSGDPEGALLNDNVNYDQLLTINLERNMSTGNYKFTLDSPSSKQEKFKFDDNRWIDNKCSAESCKKEINDKLLNNFLIEDVNNCGSVHAQSPRDRTDKFLSSRIQAETTEKLTEEFAYFKQFCHTRSSANCQLFLTINFFKEHMDLLSQDKWRIVCELNLLQPRILLTALEYNSDTINILFYFLERGLIENITSIDSNEILLFFIKMQIIFNNYITEYNNGIYKSTAINNLNGLNAKIINILHNSREEETKAKLYHYQALLLSYLIPLESFENRSELIKNYVEAKLESVHKLNSMIQTDPEEFVRQEQMCLSMNKYILQHSEEIKIYCKEKLQKKISINLSEYEAIFNCPNVIYVNQDNTDTVVLNLETFTILKNGKAYLNLPQNIFTNDQFVDLFNNEITQAFQYASPNKPDYSIFFINYKQNDYFVEKDKNKYVFQKDIKFGTDNKRRYQLLSYIELQGLSYYIPKTLIDNNHRFWVSIERPTKLLIEQKNTSTIICEIRNFNTKYSEILSDGCKLFTQHQVEYSLFGKIFSKFESKEFIQIKIDSNGRYIISLPRYNLDFNVVNNEPLTIACVSKPGYNLILSEQYNNKTDIKNALFLEKAETNEIVALIPRQYFVKSNNNDDKFEYTQICLDLTNKRQDFILQQKDSEKVYCDQSEFLEFKLEQNSKKLLAKDSQDALYLAYVHLANFNPYDAMKVLKECEKSGGLCGSAKELEHLMLMFIGLPAQTGKFQDEKNNRINTPEFIAVKTFALYLYANFKNKQIETTPIKPLNSDGIVFSQDAKTWLDKKLQQDIFETLDDYQQTKNNIPIEMQLTNKQELECYSLNGVNLLNLQRQRILLDGLKQEASLITENNNAAEQRLFMMLKNNDLFVQKQIKYKDEPCNIKSFLRLSESAEDIKRLNDLIKPNDEYEQSTLKLNPSLNMEEFFKHYVYFYKVASSSLGMESEKALLKKFLESKIKILGNNHYIFGGKLLVMLYFVLCNPDKFDKKSNHESFYNLEGQQGWYATRTIKVFSFVNFYNYLEETIKGLEDIELPVSGVKSITVAKSKNFGELLAEQTGNILKPKDYAAPIPIVYPRDTNILKKHNLQSLSEILKNLKDVKIFYEEYTALLSTNNEKVNIQKKQASSSLLTDGFEQMVAKELEQEQILGKVQNDQFKQQIDCSNKYLQDVNIREKIGNEICKSIISSENKAKELLAAIIEKANGQELSPEVKAIRQLGIEGKFLPILNKEQILNLYLLGDEQSFIDATGLSRDQVQQLYGQITEYLVVLIHSQQLSSIKQQLENLNKITETNAAFSFALRDLANNLVSYNLVDYSTDAAALNVFQASTKTLLRQDQIDYLKEHITHQDGKFKDVMSQLIMGFGKTFLLPIVAKVKATGTNLSVIEVPDALFETNTVDLNNMSMRYLNQKTNAFRFNRNTLCTVESLNELYIWLVSIKQNRDYLVTTGESVASINLRYFEVLKAIAALNNNPDAAELKDLQKKAELLEKIVKLFKFEADVIIDEVHSGLNVRKKLIYSLGEVGVSQIETSGIVELYKFILPIKVYENYTIEQIINKPGVIPSEEQEWNNIMKIIVEALVNELNSPLNKLIIKLREKNKDISVIKAYLLNELTETNVTNLNNIFEEFNNADKEIIALYKAEITRLLPSTLRKEHRKHYGLLSDEKNLTRNPCAVPFMASDSPHVLSKKDGILITTNFANQDETINYTIQAYIISGVPSFMVQAILERFKQQASIELSKSQAINYDSTNIGRLFKQFIVNQPQFEGITLDNFDKNQGVFKSIVDFLQKDKNFMFYALLNEILPKIKVEKSTLEHNSNQHAYLYRSVQGISGTTDNYRSIAKMTFAKDKYIGTNGISIDHIVSKKPGINVITRDLIIELLSKKIEFPRLMHAVIDAGGLFTGVTNNIVAQKIAEYFKSQQESKRKYILFFNEDNQLCACNVNNSSEVILIGASNKQAIQQKLNCNENEWFTYYDQRHTEGTDIAQASNAVAAITFSYDTTLTKFLQAAMRMRGLAKDQTLEIFAEQHIFKSCFSSGGQSNIKEIIEFLNNNEIESISEEHFRYTLQQMDNILYQELLLILLNDTANQFDKAKIFDIVNKHSNMFLQTKTNNLFSRYGEIENSNIELSFVLQKKKEDLVKLRINLLTEINNAVTGTKDVVMLDNYQFEKSLDAVIKHGIGACKKTVLFRQNIEQDAEVEVEAEAEQQTQTQTQTENHLEVSTIEQIKPLNNTSYCAWISDNIEDIINNPLAISNHSYHAITVNSMIWRQQTSNVNLGIIWDDNLYISINHAKMYEAQYDLLDEYKMAAQIVLMIKRPNGMLQSLIITPNEAQELISKKSNIFLNHSSCAAWIESYSGDVIVGQRPVNLEKDLNYLKIKEQIKFFNGDMKSLLKQSNYVWVPKQLEIKKNLLNSKLLISRPDQTGYVRAAFSDIQKMAKKHENIAIKLLLNQPHEEKDDEVVNIARELLQVDSILNLQKTDQLKSACKLIVNFESYDVNDQLLEQLYPELDDYAKQQLIDLYKAKQEIISQPNLSGIALEILNCLLQEAIVSREAKLIELLIQSRPDLLNNLDFAEFVSNNHDYVIIDIITKNYFSTRNNGEKENALWLRQEFSYACEHKDLSAVTILIKNSRNLDIGEELEEKVIGLLVENFQTELLDKFIEKAHHEYKTRIVNLKDKYTTLAKVLKACSTREYWSRDSDVSYIENQPHFAINGFSQLMLACLVGNYEKYCWFKQASLNEILHDKQRIFGLAVDGRNEKIISDLVKNNGDLIENLNLSNIAKILRLLSVEKFEDNFDLNILTTLFEKNAFFNDSNAEEILRLMNEIQNYLVSLCKRIFNSASDKRLFATVARIFPNVFLHTYSSCCNAFGGRVKTNTFCELIQNCSQAEENKKNFLLSALSNILLAEKNINREFIDVLVEVLVNKTDDFDFCLKILGILKNKESVKQVIASKFKYNDVRESSKIDGKIFINFFKENVDLFEIVGAPRTDVEFVLTVLKRFRVDEQNIDGFLNIIETLLGKNLNGISNVMHDGQKNKEDIIVVLLSLGLKYEKIKQFILLALHDNLAITKEVINSISFSRNQELIGGLGLDVLLQIFVQNIEYYKDKECFEWFVQYLGNLKSLNALDVSSIQISVNKLVEHQELEQKNIIKMICWSKDRELHKIFSLDLLLQIFTCHAEYYKDKECFQWFIRYCHNLQPLNDADVLSIKIMMNKFIENSEFGRKEVIKAICFNNYIELRKIFSLDLLLQIFTRHAEYYKDKECFQWFIPYCRNLQLLNDADVSSIQTIVGKFIENPEFDQKEVIKTICMNKDSDLRKIFNLDLLLKIFNVRAEYYKDKEYFELFIRYCSNLQSLDDLNVSFMETMVRNFIINFENFGYTRNTAKILAYIFAETNLDVLRLIIHKLVSEDKDSAPFKDVWFEVMRKFISKPSIEGIKLIVTENAIREDHVLEDLDIKNFLQFPQHILEQSFTQDEYNEFMKKVCDFDAAKYLSVGGVAEIANIVEREQLFLFKFLLKNLVDESQISDLIDAAVNNIKFIPVLVEFFLDSDNEVVVNEILDKIILLKHLQDIKQTDEHKHKKQKTSSNFEQISMAFKQALSFRKDHHKSQLILEELDFLLLKKIKNIKQLLIEINEEVQQQVTTADEELLKNKWNYAIDSVININKINEITTVLEKLVCDCRNENKSGLTRLLLPTIIDKNIVINDSTKTTLLEMIIVDKSLLGEKEELKAKEDLLDLLVGVLKNVSSASIKALLQQKRSIGPWSDKQKDFIASVITVDHLIEGLNAGGNKNNIVDILIVLLQNDISSDKIFSELTERSCGIQPPIKKQKIDDVIAAPVIFSAHAEKSQLLTQDIIKHLVGRMLNMYFQKPYFEKNNKILQRLLEQGAISAIVIQQAVKDLVIDGRQGVTYKMTLLNTLVNSYPVLCNALSALNWFDLQQFLELPAFKQASLEWKAEIGSKFKEIIDENFKKNSSQDNSTSQSNYHRP